MKLWNFKRDCKNNNRTLAIVLDFVPDRDRSMEVFLLALSLNLKANGWTLVHCYTGEPGEYFRQRLIEMDIQYIVSPPILNSFVANKIGRKLKKFNVNVLLTAFYSAFSLPILQLRLISRVKHWILSDHTSGVLENRSYLYNLLAKIRGASVGLLIDKVITCSNYIRTRDIQGLYFAPEKVLTVHNGINTNRYFPIARTECDMITIAYAGQLIPEKGIATLLDAVAGLEGNIRLLIAGAGRQRSELELRARKLGLLPEWLGQIDWIPRLFAESDIAVFPSIWAEAFGLVVAEAMACEACVVASDVGGIPEVVGDAGIIVPVGDVVALRKALILLISDPTRRRLLAKAGRQRVIDRFSIDRMVEGYVAVLQEFA